MTIHILYTADYYGLRVICVFSDHDKAVEYARKYNVPSWIVKAYEVM